MTGPSLRGAGDPNPFAIPVDVVFTAPSGKTTRVPGFFDGDGAGRLDGAVWKVRFSADEVGTWRFRAESPNEELDGCRGSVREFGRELRGRLEGRTDAGGPRGGSRPPRPPG